MPEWRENGAASAPPDLANQRDSASIIRTGATRDVAYIERTALVPGHRARARVSDSLTLGLVSSQDAGYAGWIAFLGYIAIVHPGPG